MSRLKQLGKDTAVYGIGKIISSGIGFFLLPLYTRIFSPADYGTIEMLTVVTSLVSQILVMGMDSAQSFYFFQEKSHGKAAQARVISAILQWRLMWGAIIVFVCTLLSPMLSIWFFGGTMSWYYFAVVFTGALFFQVLSQSVEILRLLYRPWDYITITITQTVGSTLLIIFFVLVLNQGILGYFVGSLLASLFAALVGWYMVREFLDFSEWHFDKWPRLLRFGVPLLPAGFAFYGMSTADRWFIQHYHSTEMLGIYAVGAKFSLFMALGVEAFRTAWWPMATEAMHSDEGPRTFRMIARLFMGLGITAIVLLTALSPLLVQWFSAPAFHSAWPLVGVMAWQALLYGFFLIASAGIWKTEKTFLSLYLMGGAALLNILLNYLFVPDFGGMGAAVATVITYFFWIVISMILSERLWHVGYSIAILALQVVIGGVFVSLFLMTYDFHNTLFWFCYSFASIVILLFISLDGKQRSSVKTKVVLQCQKFLKN